MPVELAFGPGSPQKEDDNTARRLRRVASNDDSDLGGPSQDRSCLVRRNEVPSTVLDAPRTARILVLGSAMPQVATQISFTRCLKVVDTFRPAIFSAGGSFAGLPVRTWST